MFGELIAYYRFIAKRLLYRADTVEKLYIFLGGKFIFDVTNFKIWYMGRDQEPTFSSVKATGEPT